MAHDPPPSATELFDRHFDRVYAYVAYRVAPDHAAAADITQDVFLAAVGRMPAHLADGSVVRWLRTVARNKVADHFRARLRRGDEFLQEVGRFRNGSHAPASEAEERAMLVGRVMRELPDRYVNLLEDKYIEGLSLQEIADRAGSSPQAIASALTRARDAFRKKYGEILAQEEATS